MDDQDTIVLNVGSLNARVGWAGAAQPQCIQRDADLLGSASAKALKEGRLLETEDLSNLILTATHGGLQASPRAQPLLVVDRAGPDAQTQRRHYLEAVLEVIQAPALGLLNDLAANCYAFGRTSGLIFDAGAYSTRTAVVVEGFVEPESFCHIRVGGQQQTHMLQTALQERSRKVSESVAEGLKLQHCRTALQYEYELHDIRHRPLRSEILQLPDGHQVDAAEDLLRCAELLLHPGMAGVREPGLHEALASSAAFCCEPKQWRLRSLPSLVLGCGGASQMPGLADRLTLELTHIPVVGNLQPLVACEATAARHHAAWLGGSLVASATACRAEAFVTRAEYEEHGLDACLKRL